MKNKLFALLALMLLLLPLAAAEGRAGPVDPGIARRRQFGQAHIFKLHDNQAYGRRLDTELLVDYDAVMEVGREYTITVYVPEAADGLGWPDLMVLQYDPEAYDEGLVSSRNELFPIAYLDDYSDEHENLLGQVAIPEDYPACCAVYRYSFTPIQPGEYIVFASLIDGYNYIYKTMTDDLPLTVTGDDDAPTDVSVTQALAAQCKAACSDPYDQALWVHDWLLEHVTYDSDLLRHSAADALVGGCCVCEGYARAMKMVLDEIGIECHLATSYGHAWNTVRIEDEWTQIDATWDDDVCAQHMYFGFNDDMACQRGEYRTGDCLMMDCDTVDLHYYLRPDKNDEVLIDRWLNYRVINGSRVTLLDRIADTVWYDTEAVFTLKSSFDDLEIDSHYSSASFGSVLLPLMAERLSQTTPCQCTYSFKSNALTLTLQTDIALPSALEEISDEAFSGDTSLYYLILPEGVETIGAGAFEDCTNLLRVEIPDSILSIDDTAFKGCTCVLSGGDAVQTYTGSHLNLNYASD